MRRWVTFLVLLCLVGSAGMAQRSRSGRQNKKEKITVDSLIASYRFGEAVERLEEEIEQNKKRRRPTQQLEQQLERVLSHKVMLSATERVRFVDSVVVDKKDFLAYYRVGADCGEIAAPGQLLPETLAKDREIGAMAYRNDMKDKVYFSLHREKGMAGLHYTARTGDAWSKAKPLNGLAADGVEQDYPYMMSDGVTLYYAEQNDEGLGGYDIYVTRYNPETDTYLKPENIGMPFNSPANDYLYVVDEFNNLGWFATDRRQPEGKVCIYLFQPNTTREVYNPIAMGEEGMRSVAQLRSISDSRLDEASLQEARKRLQRLMAEPSSRREEGQERYIINDSKVYTSLLDFRNKEAQHLAMEWTREKGRLEAAEKELARLRSRYRHEQAEAKERESILALEAEVAQLRGQVLLLEKKMRRAELE